MLKQESFECADYYPVGALLGKDIAVLAGSLHFLILLSSPSFLFIFCLFGDRILPGLVEGL